MRVALLGGSGQNAFVLGKVLRRSTDVDAFALFEANAGSLRLPEWEDADWPEDTGARLAHGVAAHDDHLYLPLAQPWERPGWAVPINWPQSPVLADAPAHLSGDERRTLWRDGHVLRHWPHVKTLAEQVDLVVLLGPWAAYGALLPDRSYLCVEHGTLRSVPLGDHPAQRVLAIAYRHAGHLVITNADCQRAAEAIGIPGDRSSFIPHPIQSDVFVPPADEDLDVARWRQRLRTFADGTRVELVLLAPARQTAPGDVGAKHTGLIYAAVARYVKEAERAGAPKAVLWALGYGDGLEASKRLVRTLGMEDRVRWFPLQPKRTLLRYYQAADVVLDQFAPEVGSYGAITVEALATARPVITFVDEAVHEWCATVAPVPPVHNARTVDEVYDHLVRLARDPAERQASGRRGRQWVEAYHSAERVALLHAERYSRVLAEQGHLHAARWQWTGAPVALPALEGVRA